MLEAGVKVPEFSLPDENGMIAFSIDKAKAAEDAEKMLGYADYR